MKHRAADSETIGTTKSQSEQKRRISFHLLLIKRLTITALIN